MARTRLRMALIGFFSLCFGQLLAAGDSPSPGELAAQAEQSMRLGEGEKALELLGRAVEADPDNPRWFNARGAVRFRLAMIEPSIEDFDRAIALDPAIEPHHWQRGISYYYAGEYEKGARQFELHQTVNPQDVENAVWHFLCVARWKGLDEARARLIPIKGDARVPMAEIHRLFSGKATAEDVLKAASAGNPQPRELRQRLGYAHLYVALYHEAHGQAAASLEHIRKSVDHFPASGHYMGDVARVHLRLRSDHNSPEP